MTKLPKIVTRRQKRLGRGYGSGKGGHTSGRGQKGQKSRGGLGVLFEGFKMKKSLLRRLPIQRGKTKFKPGKKPLIVNIEVLNLLANGTKVNIETLAKAGIVNLTHAKEFGVKILGNGKLEKSLILELPSSKSVQEQFAKLGKKAKKE